jgi:hypothetical protein
MHRKKKIKNHSAKIDNFLDLDNKMKNVSDCTLSSSYVLYGTVLSNHYLHTWTDKSILGVKVGVVGVFSIKRWQKLLFREQNKSELRIYY